MNDLSYKSFKAEALKDPDTKKEYENLLQKDKEFNPYKFVKDRKQIRPFNEEGKKDGNWNYVHETDVWDLIGKMQNEKEKKNV